LGAGEAVFIPDGTGLGPGIEGSFKKGNPVFHFISTWQIKPQYT